MYYKDFPFDEAKLEGRDTMAYGQWLCVEVREYNPYWQTFYKPQDRPEQTEETVLETPPSWLLNVPLLPPPTIIEAEHLLKGIQRSH